MVKKTISLILLLCFPLWLVAGVNFDGTDDLLELNVSNFGGGGAFSMSMWVIGATGQTGATGIFSTNTSGSADTFQIDVDGSDNYEIRASTGPPIVANFGAVSATVWHNLVVTYDGSSETILYYDGVLANTITTWNPSTDQFIVYRVGSNRGNNKFFEGTIDEVVIWTTTLTPSEVARLFDAKSRLTPFQIQPSSLKDYWRLDDHPDGSLVDGLSFVSLTGTGNDLVGNDGAGNANLTARAGEVLTY